jgi:putative transposase
VKHALFKQILVRTGDEKDRKEVIGDRVINGQIKVLNVKTMTEAYEQYEDLIAAIANGELYVHRDAAPLPRENLHRTDEEHDALARASQVLVVVQQTAETKSVSVNRAYEDLREKSEKGAPDAVEHPLPSRSTIYRHLALSRAGLPLLRPNSAKGNRTARHSDAVRELIVDLAEEHYLVPNSRWSLDRLVEKVNAQAREQLLLPPDKGVGKEYVVKVIHEDATTDVEKARMDPADAIAAKAVARNHISVLLPFQRVEQDALHLPFVAKTPHGISRDIWWVHAIDCAPSVPVGWFMVIGNPIVSDSLRCAERVFYPKKDLLKKHRIANAIDHYGLPMQFIFDNGAENKGRRMYGLASLGTTPIYCRAKAAHGKPFIERLNRSLKKALESLPGCTRFNGKDGARDPVALGDDLMTIEELERWIVRWYFEKWMSKPLRRLKNAIFTDTYCGSTPAACLQQMHTEQYAMPLPPNRRDWLMVRFEKDKATLNRKTGATVRTFQFAGDNLPMLIKHFGEVEVDVLVDPDDFRFVHVPVGPKAELVSLKNKVVNDETPAYSFAVAKEMYKDIKDPPQPPESVQFDKDLLARSATPQLRTAPKRKGQRAESQETTRRTKEAAAHERAAKGQELPETTVPESSAAKPTVSWTVDVDKVFPVRNTETGKERS